MPSFGGAQNYSSMLNQQVPQVAPMATQWHGALAGPNPQQVFNSVKAPVGTSPGALSQFSHFLGGTASQIGHIGGDVADWVGKTTASMAEAPVKFSYDFTTGAVRTFQESNQQDHLSAQQTNLDSLYKDGKINNKQYQNSLQSILSQRSQLSSSLKITQQRLTNSKAEGINTASDIVALVAPEIGPVLGGAGEEAAAQFLKSAGADNFFDAAEGAINKIANDPEAFKALPDSAQKAIQLSTADIVSRASGMSAAQIARTSVVNLAFKYPVYYSYISGTSDELYHQLDQKQYGAAVRTVAFNAALLLSGGPIGYALKWTGNAGKAIINGMFGEGSFIDYLSQGIGDGDPGGLVSAINKLSPEEQADAAQQLSSVEASNMSAVGKDASAAATRVLNGMESYEGVSMSSFTHEEALENMMNFAKAQRIASTTAKSVGLDNVVVGRVDARDLNEISAQLSPAISADKDTAHNVWDSMKGENPNKAWANNTNFDRQVKSLINRYDNPADLDASIRRIKASFRVESFPETEAKELSKMGYIPITPTKLEAPFTEGSGKLVTKFADNSDFFTHAVEPIPILSSLGDALTKVGLSPQASSARVYQMFTDNLGDNLKDLTGNSEIMGENEEQTTDTLIKQLTDYANNPTRGKIISKAPISDLRMMTTADIKTALKDTQFDDLDAKAVQKSIAQSYLQVPIAVRGLGDRAVDLLYKGGPIAGTERRYMRIMGAARYSWNPFFQYLRVVPKTEILSSFEGGGFISSVFSGQAGELSEVQTMLREGGFLDKQGSFGDVIGGEAVEYGGDTGRNLNKSLLPAQEKSIAGLVSSEASRLGVDTQTYIKEFPQQVRDTIQSIAEYDKNNSFLNSPLARTLNIAFFPFRFDVKVATIMTRSLARTSLMTQVSVINGLMKAHGWLNSPEGEAWYSRNANVIGFFEYITPVADLNQIFESLIPGHDHSLGNFGELGGLPFGWIPQILDDEGLTHFDQASVDAKTGDVYSQYIPKTTKGQMAIAIQDMLGSLFEYPGAEVGLPSKSSITRGVALGAVGGNKKADLQLNTPATSTLSMQQQNFIDAIKTANPASTGLNAASAANGTNKQAFSTPNQMQPGQQVPNTAPPEPPNKINSSSSTKKLKKGEYTPQLLPGQTSLGQL